MDVRAVASGLGQLLASQLSSRVLTFGLNLAIARQLTPEAYGVATVQFHLLTTSIMMLSREGFRRGCLRFKPAAGAGGTVDPWRVLSVAWLVIPLGVVITATTCAMFLALHARARADAKDVPGYATAIMMHGVAAVLELVSEPLYILAAIDMRFSLRAVMDSIPLVAKAAVTLALLAGWVFPSTAAWPPAIVFSVAQLAFATATLVGYAACVGVPLCTSPRQKHAADAPPPDGSSHKKAAAASVGQPIPGPASAGGRVLKTAACADARQKRRARGASFWLAPWRRAEEREALASTGLFWVQAVEKFLLAEGSKAVMAGLAGSYDQGVVGLVAGLGSLVVRLLFVPLEDVAFTVFSRQRVSSANRAALQARAQLLSLFVVGVSLLGLMAVAFGPPNARLAVRLVYGPRWAATPAPDVLSIYCVYILLLAVNGVTEAFVHAVLDARGLAWSNALLLGLAASHLGACALLIQAHGSVGYVAADALNMAARIGLSLWYISRHFRDLPGFSLAALLPSWQALGVFGTASAATYSLKAGLAVPDAELRLKAIAAQVGGSALVLGAVCAALFWTERSTLRALRTMWRTKAAGPDQSGAGEQDPSQEKKSQ